MDERRGKSLPENSFLSEISESNLEMFFFMKLPKKKTKKKKKKERKRKTFSIKFVSPFFTSRDYTRNLNNHYDT